MSDLETKIDSKQLNEWLDQGRTDAWIAHQLGISGSELIALKQQHGLAVEVPVEEVEEKDEPETADTTADQSDEYEATFDHGKRDGYGLWLDPSIKDDPIYLKNWAKQEAVKVKFSENEITITRP